MSTTITRKERSFRITDSTGLFDEVPYANTTIGFDGTNVLFTNPVYFEPKSYAFAGITSPDYATGYALVAELTSWVTGVDRTAASQEAGLAIHLDGYGGPGYYEVGPDDYLIMVVADVNEIRLPEEVVANRHLVIRDAGQGFATSPVALTTVNVPIEAGNLYTLNVNDQLVTLVGAVTSEGAQWLIESNGTSGSTGTVPTGTQSGSMLRWNGSQWIEDTGHNSQATTYNLTKSSSIQHRVQSGAVDNYAYITLASKRDHIETSATDVYDKVTTGTGSIETATNGTNLSSTRIKNDSLIYSATDASGVKTTTLTVEYPTGFDLTTTDITDGTKTTQMALTLGGNGLMLVSDAGSSTNIDYETRVEASPTDTGFAARWVRVDNTDSGSLDFGELELSGNETSITSQHQVAGADFQTGYFKFYRDGGTGILEMYGDNATDPGAVQRVRINAEDNTLKLNATIVGGANTGDAVCIASTEALPATSVDGDASPVLISGRNASFGVGVVNSVGLGVTNKSIAQSGTVYTGGRVYQSVEVTDDYTILPEDHLVVFSTGVAKTLTLPNAVAGRTYIIHNADAVESVDVATSGGATLMGGASPQAQSPGTTLNIVYIAATNNWISI